MVLRAEAVRSRLLKLEEVISHLEEIGRPDETLLTEDFRTAWMVERGLQLGAETVLDIGNHILSGHFGVSAEDYEDVIAQLGVNQVIDASLHRRLKGLGGFRNILVHGYLRLDPQRVAEYLCDAPKDFADFARAIRAWLSGVI